MEMVSGPTTAEAIAAVAAALDTLQSVGVTPADAADARASIVGLETVARRVRSLQVDLVGEVDRAGTHVARVHPVPDPVGHRPDREAPCHVEPGTT